MLDGFARRGGAAESMFGAEQGGQVEAGGTYALDIVDATAIDPGMVDTEFSEVRFHGDAERARAVYRGMRPLTADDVAEVVLFAAGRPAHVNLAQVLLLPTDQASATHVNRRK